MTSVENLIKKYLAQGRMMQVATARDDKPWICTVYFVEDELQRLYWLSLPSRRHSQEIAANRQVAVAVPVKFDKPVVGIQAEGVVDVVLEPDQVAKVMQLYTDRYNTGKDFYSNFIVGKNRHQLYRFTPQKYVLFDEVNFPNNGRQEWIPL